MKSTASVVGITKEKIGGGERGAVVVSSWLSLSRDEGGVMKTLEIILLIGVFMVWACLDLVKRAECMKFATEKQWTNHTKLSRYSHKASDKILKVPSNFEKMVGCHGNCVCTRSWDKVWHMNSYVTIVLS